MTSTRALVIGFDACDPVTAEAFVRRGDLPNLGKLFERGARCRVRSPYGLFVGAIWVSLTTGLDPVRHGVHCWDEIDIASYERRLTTMLDFSTETFWAQASRAGRRAVVIDVPHTRASVPLNGIQIVEWGCHDRHFGLHSWPPMEVDAIESEFGTHPVLGIEARVARDFASDDYAHREGMLRMVEEERLLLSGLLEGHATKSRLSCTYLEQENWDLFITVFGESHAIGHQQWHLHDASHPRFDPLIRAEVGGDPLLQVYRALDASLGELLARVDDDTMVFVLLSHGMGPHYDGCHLLDEVLRRIDLVDHGSELSGLSGFAKRAAMRLPVGPRRRAFALAVPALRRIARRRDFTPCPEFMTADERAGQQFFLEPNNFVYGGVRLNLVSREPRGCVGAADADRVCTGLANDLLSLVNVATGRPVVKAVERTDRWYPNRGLDTIPDLFVEWERSALIETVWSPKTGLVHAPYENWRTGDHRPDGLLLMTGSDLPSRAILPPIDAIDLAPTIAHHLGVELDDVDGRPAPWMPGYAMRST